MRASTASNIGVVVRAGTAKGATLGWKGVVLLGFLGEKFLVFRSDPVAPRADRMRKA
jgi:hypothetical protein